uniref:Zn(2)-C6 fungal-type domain-containing protein n=1 Tax=Mycena chlorophos TaxID=658473 RepID=A0ABQ0M880_MYCCL|nr:predicted protein [Mycena chlorophos]
MRTRSRSRLTRLPHLRFATPPPESRFRRARGYKSICLSCIEAANASHGKRSLVMPKSHRIANLAGWVRSLGLAQTGLRAVVITRTQARIWAHPDTEDCLSRRSRAGGKRWHGQTSNKDQGAFFPASAFAPPLPQSQTPSFSAAFRPSSPMDVEYGALETDHRKRRRNRTTQSCLNCHTSKRKCDRKRPCQRCIQLGLTGLCVYEIDDPALRDDPSLDENTRLRNRIAELESLVRELRGKPHPRWADAALHSSSADPNEKWHSRASKQLQQPHAGPSSASSSSYQPPSSLGKRRLSSPGRHHHSHGPHGLLPPIKTEADLGGSLYRLGVGSGLDGDLDGNGVTPPPSSAPPRYFSSSGLGLMDDEDDAAYCPCRHNGGGTFANLSHALDNALAVSRGYHAQGHGGCALWRRMLELGRVLGSTEPTSATTYDLTSSGSGSGTPPLPLSHSLPGSLDDNGAPPGTAGSTSSSHSHTNNHTHTHNPANNTNPSLLSPLSTGTSASFPLPPTNAAGPGSPHSSASASGSGGGTGSPGSFHHSHAAAHAQSHSQQTQGTPGPGPGSTNGGGGSPGEWGGYTSVGVGGSSYFHDVGVGVGVHHGYTSHAAAHQQHQHQLSPGIMPVSLPMSGLGLIHNGHGGGMSMNGHGGHHHASHHVSVHGHGAQGMPMYGHGVMS